MPEPIYIKSTICSIERCYYKNSFEEDEGCSWTVLKTVQHFQWLPPSTPEASSKMMVNLKEPWCNFVGDKNSYNTQSSSSIVRSIHASLVLLAYFAPNLWKSGCEYRNNQNFNLHYKKIGKIYNGLLLKIAILEYGAVSI